MRAVLGVLTIVFGLLISGAGVVGGVVRMIEEIKREGQAVGAVPPAELPTGFIEAMSELTKALTDAPTWLAITIVGILLIFVGMFLLYRAEPKA